MVSIFWLEEEEEKEEERTRRLEFTLIHCWGL